MKNNDRAKNGKMTEKNNAKAKNTTGPSKERFISCFMKTGLTPEERLLKVVFGDNKNVAGIKPTPKKFRTLENAERLWEESQRSYFFNESLKIPKKVAAMLAEHNKWRRGKGKYAPHVDPNKNAPAPFTAKQLGRIIDSAVAILKEI